jgi:hypothetical protein
MRTPARIVVVTLWLLLGLAGRAWAPDGAPEIDPTSAAAGLTLVVGSILLYLDGRFRR